MKLYLINSCERSHILKIFKNFTAGIITISALSINLVWASDLTIYVAPRGSDAHQFAISNFESPVEKRIHKAFQRAADHLNSCGNCSVDIRLAGGEYLGKAKVGLWTFPQVQAPDASLKILGGWNDDFTQRNPFSNPTVLKSNENRSSVVLRFEGRKHRFGEIVVSGLTFDTTPSNNYDSKTNSFTRSGSSTFAQISFGYITTDRLIISDNTFIGSADGGVGGPIVKPVSNNGEVRVENNVFFNNLVPWTLASGSYSVPPKLYLVKGNSFILNWPYNADASTSNPGALQIGNKYVATQVQIERNLFAYNYGGAIFPQWDDTKGPEIEIKDNLFYENGGLFDPTGSDAGAVVGKFAGAAAHSIFSSEEIEDDFNWRVAGNISIDPKLDIGVPSTVGISSTGQRSDNRSDKPTDQEVASGIDDPGSPEDLEAELATLSAALDDSLASLETPSAGADSAPELDADLDLDLDLDFKDYENEEIAGQGLKNYAPKIIFESGALPFPTNPDAVKFGASPARITNY
jgi:hypothetical protein